MSRKKKLYLIFSILTLIILIVRILTSEDNKEKEIITMILAAHAIHWLLIYGIHLQLNVARNSEFGFTFFLNLIKVFRITFLILGSLIVIPISITAVITSKYYNLDIAAVGLSLLFAGLHLKDKINSEIKSV